MNRTSNESEIVTGIAWYRPEQWERLREVSEDVENLEETYEEWLQKAERLLHEGIPADLTIEKVDLDVEEVLAWCNFHGLPMNAQSRSKYVSEMIRKQYDAL
jgi:catechol-2,3-dioxygenase